MEWQQRASRPRTTAPYTTGVMIGGGASEVLGGEASVWKHLVKATPRHGFRRFLRRGRLNGSRLTRFMSHYIRRVRVHRDWRSWDLHGITAPAASGHLNTWGSRLLQPRWLRHSRPRSQIAVESGVNVLGACVDYMIKELAHVLGWVVSAG